MGVTGFACSLGELVKALTIYYTKDRAFSVIMGNGISAFSNIWATPIAFAVLLKGDSDPIGDVWKWSKKAESIIAYFGVQYVEGMVFASIVDKEFSCLYGAGHSLMAAAACATIVYLGVFLVSGTYLMVSDL